MSTGNFVCYEVKVDEYKGSGYPNPIHQTDEAIHLFYTKEEMMDFLEKLDFYQKEVKIYFGEIKYSYNHED